MQSSSSRFLKFLLMALTLAVFCPVSGFSQGSQLPKADQSQPGQPPATDEETRIRAEKEMAKRANQERQAQLKRDTDQLLELATQLKMYVDRTNENVLSLDVIKKADQIEKLAHNVKEKMRAE